MDLLDGLDPAQRAAVTSTASPLCVLAGAGSGKTRVLTRRIAWRLATGDAQAAHVLALTFTRKAAGELAGRLRVLGIRDQVAAGTFHAVAYAQLRRRWADEGRPPPALLDRKVRVLAQLLPRNRAGVGGAAVQPADAAGEIEWAKARMVAPDDYAAEAEGAGRRPPLPPSAMAALYARYEEEKRRRGLVDFDDLLALCADAVETDPAFAAAQRWRFRHLFVDEFQDVNPAQYRLLSAWLGDSVDLCVVGDPRQAIYSWNGADPTLLTRFPEVFPGAEVVSLEENYRSSPQVLGVAAAVLGGPALRPNRPDGPVPEIRSFPTEEKEAQGVARLVRQARRPGAAWSDLAVLARTNAQLPQIERALRAAQVPYRVAGGAGFLNQPEIRDALQALGAAPPGSDFGSSLADLGVSTAASTPDAEDGRADGPADGSAVEQRRLQLAHLVELGREYAAMDPAPSASGFRAWLTASMADSGDGRRADAVTLATFHRAKGLEWPVVFLVGLERGLVPIGRASGPAAEAEERRLLYVAVTRAAERLVCTWAQRRSFGAKPMTRTASPFLDPIEAACAEMAGGARPVRSGAGIRAARARLERVPRRPAEEIAADADPAVMTALRKWRAGVARASGVPAYVIFHDSTLAAVAAARPRTPEQLLGLPGVGPVKVSRYGPDLLALLAEHPAV